MPKVTISASAFSVQQAHPNSRYRSINPIPLKNSYSNQMLLRTGLSRVPRKATILSATLRLAQSTETTGTRTIEVRPITSQWDSNVTWNKRPSYGGLIDSVTQGAGPMSRRWLFDLTQAVQNRVNGTTENQGWRVTTPDEWLLKMRGAPANSRPPDLVIEYVVAPEEPTNLHPSSGVVSVSNPWLTFDADDEITALQVQIDPAASASAPAWDSGTVTATGGLLALDDPDLDPPYPGLAEGETTYWRVRQRTAGGWSGWSEWAQMVRDSPATLTITQPPEETIGDETPTVGWEFTGHQTAWRVRIFDDDGDQLAGSGTNVGDDTLWAPRTGFTRTGQSGFIQVDVWDDTDRIATPDAPDYITATMPVTFVYDPTIDPVDTLEATQPDSSPDVVLTGTRAVIPDRLSLYRSLEGGPFTLVKVFDALEVFEGTTFTLVDLTAPMNCPSVAYYVAAGVGDRYSEDNPTVELATGGIGVWITDLDTGDRAVVWGVEAEQEATETAIEHEPLNRTSGHFNQRIVRRRLVTYQPRGTITGIITSISRPGTPDAAECERLFRAWRNADAGHRYQLHLGRFTSPVILGNIALTEREENRVTDRLLNVSFAWWGDIGPEDI